MAGSAHTALLTDELPDTDGLDEVTVDDEGAAEAPNARRSPGILGIYFQEVGANDILTAEEELALAREIEERDLDVWVELLSYPPLVDHLLAVLETELEGKFAPTDAFRRAAKGARSSRSKKARCRLEKTVRRVAFALRELDPDRAAQTALRHELAAIEAGGSSSAAFRATRLSTRARAFRDFADRVRAAEQRAIAVRNQFVRANLRLVVSIARRYAHGPMALPDLIQEGNLGLIKAVDRFDHRRGFRFSTYASWWIRHAIGRAVADKGREVRIPVHMVDATYRLRKAHHTLTARLGREPTQEELAGETELSIGKLAQMDLCLLGHPLSFDHPVANEDDRTLLDVFQDPDAPVSSPVELLADAQLEGELQALLAELSPLELDILRRRFGLDDGEEHTLQAIAEIYGRSRERIRQLQAQALDRLHRAFIRRRLV